MPTASCFAEFVLLVDTKLNLDKGERNGRPVQLERCKDTTAQTKSGAGVGDQDTLLS